MQQGKQHEGIRQHTGNGNREQTQGTWTNSNKNENVHNDWKWNNTTQTNQTKTKHKQNGIASCMKIHNDEHESQYNDIGELERAKWKETETKLNAQHHPDNEMESVDKESECSRTLQKQSRIKQKGKYQRWWLNTAENKDQYIKGNAGTA